ncbi:MAG: hypothetical protein SO116_04555 [Treponema sp.]|nr:hypothetical protein [Spirochaetia bacterium]MDD7013809.1 hypothetical protein [Spirochaetales bacterium]MDY4902126.1 hypothetical protein [Treponema sp.]
MCEKKSPEKEIHWSEKKEVAKSSSPITFMIFLVKIFPHWFLALIAVPVGFFYFVFSSAARKECKTYQRNVIDFGKKKNLPTIKRVNSFRQILSFALCLVEKVEGWCGKLKLKQVIFQDDSILELKNQLSQGKGALLIGSHLGNIELLRCLASEGKTGVEKNVPVTSIMDVNVTANFNKSMEKINSKAYLDVIPADKIGIDTIEILQDRINQGGLVVTAGDRTSSSNPQRSIDADFLGKSAAFPYGSFFLASLLNAPVYFVFALRTKSFSLRSKYKMIVKKIDVDFNCSRAEKKNRCTQLCRSYAAFLENYCLSYTFQWYNFYNFWAK